MNIVTRAFWIGIGLALCLVAPAWSAEPERVLARTKDFEIKQSDLDEAFINLKGALAAQGRDVPEAQRPAVERQLVEKLVLTRILLGKASETDRKVAKEKVDRILTAEKERAKSQARYEAQVRALGMSPDAFEKQLLERGICEQVLERDLRPKLGITPEKVRAFYDQNPDKFAIPERVKLVQVVLSRKSPAGKELTEVERIEKETLAKRIVDRVKQGENLAELARQFSDDPAGRERGGEYLFPVGRMVLEFEAAVKRLETNQVSEVVSTPSAWHVIKLLERLPAEQTAFEKVAPQIRDGLEMEATQAALPALQKELFAAAAVEFTVTDAK